MVTFILPTIGTRASLERAIASVDEQTVPCKLIVVYDIDRMGAGPSRNCVVNQVTTPWVAFIDDDDALDLHYVEWLMEEAQDNDVVVFRMKYMQDVWSVPAGTILPLPKDPTMRHGNVGISFAMKTELLKALPFIKEGKPGCGPSEDWHMMDALINGGYKIKISDRIAYYVRPV